MAGAVEASVPLSHLDDVLDYLETGHDYTDLKEAGLFIYGHIGTCDLHGMWVAPVSTAPGKAGADWQGGDAVGSGYQREVGLCLR